MDYTGWTKADLIAEITALNTKIDTRVAKREKQLEKSYAGLSARLRADYQHKEKAAKAEYEAMLAEDKSVFKKFFEQAAEDLITAVDDIVRDKSYRWYNFAKYYKDPITVEMLPHGLAYHYRELKQELKKPDWMRI